MFSDNMPNGDDGRNGDHYGDSMNVDGGHGHGGETRDRSPRRDSRRDYSPAPERRSNRQRRTAPEPSKVLGVFSLNTRTRENELEEEFGRYGVVEKVTIVYDGRESDRSRGFGFVTMSTPEEATKCIEALNGVKLGGREIRVDYSLTNGPHQSTPGQYMGRRTDRARRDDFRGGPRGGGSGGGGGRDRDRDHYGRDRGRYDDYDRDRGGHRGGGGGGRSDWRGGREYDDKDRDAGRSGGGDRYRSERERDGRRKSPDYRERRRSASRSRSRSKSRSRSPDRERRRTSASPRRDRERERERD